MKFCHSLLLLIAMGISAYAETPAGFAEIRFGASKKEAEAAMKARDGVMSAESSGERLTFTGGTFSGQPVSRWTLTFVADRFAVGNVVIDNVKKPVYDDLKEQLTKKYGKFDSEKGHHSWECLWEFRSDGRRTVRLHYDAHKVDLTYSHDALAKAKVPGKKSDL